MLQRLLKKLRKEPASHQAEPSLMNSYSRLPVSFVRGEGAVLWDKDDKQYIDALGGIAVTFLGHCHPKISEAISLQANKILHVSNLFHIPEQAELGKKFCAISGMERVFFGNSGAEANEAAIKISRLYARKLNIESPIVITAENSFHGRTMATLSATGNDAIKKGFSPVLNDFIHVPYNDSDAIKAHSENPNVVAVLIEPIQGESGVILPDQGYLTKLREICDQNNWLLMLDEIQTGMGRTGKWFAYQHEDIKPDVLTSAKALGNGIPIGACAARGDAAELISPGSHGTTFGGNPFATQVACTVIDLIEQEDLIAKAEELGADLKKQLQQQLTTLDKVVDIRGKGLMLAVELDHAYSDLALKFLNAGLVINITGGGKIIRLLPSVMLTDKQIKRIVAIMQEVISGL